MNATITPSITAADAAAYQSQMEQVAKFATRLHIDVADGTLSPVSLMRIEDIWWPGGVRADIHVMYKRPLEHLEALLALQPQLIILHAEGTGNFAEFAEAAHRHGIETGIALQQATPVETIKPALDMIDHVLVFSGNLGEFGGKADPTLLSKVRLLKSLKPQLEIGWDGGVNARNASALERSGVEVLNVGGFIHRAQDAAAAYRALAVALGQAEAPWQPVQPATAPVVTFAPVTQSLESVAPAHHIQVNVSRSRGASLPVRRLNVDLR